MMLLEGQALAVLLEPHKDDQDDFSILLRSLLMLL